MLNTAYQNSSGAADHFYVYFKEEVNKRSHWIKYDDAIITYDVSEEQVLKKAKSLGTALIYCKI